MNSKVLHLEFPAVTAMLLVDRASRSDQPLRPLVLVVDDDARLSSSLEDELATAGYRVERTTNGQQALATFQALAPDLVLLDAALPGLDGLELTRRLREHTGVPILMVSASDDIGARVAGLDAGADDFLHKPFATEELLARLRALLRGRALAAADARAELRHGPLAYADVQLNQDTREAFRGTRRLELRNKALELLACFLHHPERVLSRRELLEEVWGYEFLGDSNVIEVTVGHLRQALESAGELRLIHTVRPVGYILRMPNGERHCQGAPLTT